MVHWEQSFNCFGSDSNKHETFEAFIRQTTQMPSGPIVVLSESGTPNWPPSDCAKEENKVAPVINSDEHELLQLLTKNEAIKIATEKNTGQYGPWSQMTELFKSYQTKAGIQLWQHDAYGAYKCHGPYVKEWQCCQVCYNII